MICPACGVETVPTETLTRRQRDVLEFITTYFRREGMTPTFRETAAGLGLSSQATVHQHVGELERKGFIARKPHDARALVVL